jgi:hypothetical protein
LRATSQASFVLPGTRRSHPFTARRAGYSYDVARWAAMPEVGVNVLEHVELRVHDGLLRCATVQQQAPEGTNRTLAFAAWEHANGCITTSRHGTDAHGIARRLTPLPFRASPSGCTLALAVDASLRPPVVMTDAPGLGVLFIRPQTKRVLARVPAGRGRAVEGGELFRVRVNRPTLLLVTDTAVVDIQPRAEHADALEVARSLRIEWEPPAR